MEKEDYINKINKLIKSKEVTAYQIANKTSLTEAGIGKILSGKSKNPRQSSLVEILNYLENLGKDETSEPFRNNEPIQNKNGNTYHEHPNGGYIIQAPLIPFPAYASFIEVYEDEKGYLQFENASFKVDHVGRGKYVAFSTIGDSMNGGEIDDTPHGAEVLGRELSREHWRDGFKPSKYGWILVSHTGIMHKDIVSDIDENGCIKLHSRNPSPEYKDFEIDINSIHSIWKVIKRTF